MITAAEANEVADTYINNDFGKLKDIEQQIIFASRKGLYFVVETPLPTSIRDILTDSPNFYTIEDLASGNVKIMWT